MARHPEESVLVDFGSVKSQKNMWNIWSLVRRGEGSEGLLEGRSRRLITLEGEKEGEMLVVEEISRSITLTNQECHSYIKLRYECGKIVTISNQSSASKVPVCQCFIIMTNIMQMSRPNIKSMYYAWYICERTR